MHDILIGDTMLFQNAEQVEASRAAAETPLNEDTRHWQTLQNAA